MSNDRKFPPVVEAFMLAFSFGALLFVAVVFAANLIRFFTSGS